MHGVIGVTPVCCNTTSLLHPCSAGPSVGHKPLINRRGQGAIWEKWALSAASENVWSNALNYWGQWLHSLCWFVRGHRRLTDIEGHFSTAEDCELRDMPAPEQLMWVNTDWAVNFKTPLPMQNTQTRRDFEGLRLNVCCCQAMLVCLYYISYRYTAIGAPLYICQPDTHTHTHAKHQECIFKHSASTELNNCS